MNHERLARTNGLLGEGEIDCLEKSPERTENSEIQNQKSPVVILENSEIQPIPSRRLSQPPPILCRTWVLFVSCFVGIPTGSIYSWSVLIDDLTEAYPTWHHTSIPTTVSCIFVGYGLIQFFFGNWKALRALAIIATFITSGGYMICYAGLMMDKVYLFFFGGFINGAGLGFARLAFVNYVKSWFEYDAALVASWVGTVSALGGAVFAWGFRYYIDSVSLETDAKNGLIKTFFWTAITVGCTQLWGAVFIQEHLSERIYGETPYRTPMTFKDMLRHSQFWKIMIVYFTNLAPMIGVLSVFASRIRNYGRINKVIAATYLAMLCLVSAASRMCVRATARAVGPKFLGGCLNLGGAATFIIITYSLDSSSPPVMTLVWLIIANACFAASFGLTEELCAKIFGRASGPRVYWRVSLAIPLAGIVGPSMISIDPDNYFHEYCYGSAGLLLVGLIVLCTITKAVRKRGYGSLV